MTQSKLDNGQQQPNPTDVTVYLEQMEQAAQGTFWTYLGCKMERLTDQELVISLDAQPHHLNVIGIVHGGVISSLLDNAMGAAVMALRPHEKVVTTNLNVHFVSPLKAGKLIVKASVLHQTRKSITAQATVSDQEGTLGSIGTGSFRVI
ncbi:PaaI family thioesterase [Paenibacillus turpanensis]|uniref:PaaI family thioesterase n=1 Tax=Paenibacillus turpanensis TaxID=2689078 RepID=UPI001FB5ACEA|nr:PaaI family thioesterase [Paenibacillus turpanensis]